MLEKHTIICVALLPPVHRGTHSASCWNAILAPSLACATCSTGKRKDPFVGKHSRLYERQKAPLFCCRKPAISYVCVWEWRKKNSLEKGRRRRNRKRNNAMLLLHLSTFFVSICCNSVNEWEMSRPRCSKQ